MDPYVLRPLIFACIEFTLAFIVCWKGKVYKFPIWGMLFLLAGYQLGEFLFLQYDLRLGLQISLFSTSLLPPLGILLIQKANKINIGYVVYQIVGMLFAITLLFNPEIYTGARGSYCLVKYVSLSDTSSMFIKGWAIYYISGLSLALLVGFVMCLKPNISAQLRRHNIWITIGYASFFPLSYVLTLLCGGTFSQVASFTCALALGSAFIMSAVSLKILK